MAEASARKFRRTARDKACDEFCTFVDAYLEGKAGKPDQWGDYHLATPLGTLRCRPDRRLEGEHVGRLFTVYTKFDDVDTAKLGMAAHEWNPYSGKWNFHQVSDDAAGSFESFRDDIERVLAIRLVPNWRYAMAAMYTFLDAHPTATLAHDWQSQCTQYGRCEAIVLPEAVHRILLIKVDRNW